MRINNFVNKWTKKIDDVVKGDPYGFALMAIFGAFYILLVWGLFK